MKNILALLFFLICSGVSAQKVEKIWETGKDFKVPESVLYSDTILYVSNVNGKPTEKNGKGFISKLSTDGQNITLNWASGLDAPKGMGIYNAKLYVSNIDNVVVIDLKDGNIINRIEIPNSEFLNDISVSSTGVIAVSDMQTKTIHFIKNDQLIKSLQNELFEYVNGLFWDGNILFAGTAGIIYKIKPNEDDPIKYIEGTGGIDGLEKWDGERFIITDWSGKMQLISTHDQPIELLNTTELGIQAADIGFDPIHHIIFVPTFSNNTVSAYQLME